MSASLQVCQFDVGSWAHLASEIDIRPKEEGAADMMFFQRNSEFAVLDFQAKYKTYIGEYPHDSVFNKTKSTKFSAAQIRVLAYIERVKHPRSKTHKII